MRLSNRLLLPALALLGAAAPSHAAPAARLPNIVLILSDDYGYGSAGCYGADPRLIATPNIDRLAAQGMRFTDANTPSSVCSPTRYAVLTGRYNWRTSQNGGEVLGTLDPLHIETSRPTLASLLRGRGYRCAIVGKWHLGYGTKKPVDYTAELKPGPLELGFDYQFAVPQNHNDITRVFVENHRVYGLRSAKLTPTPGKLGLDAPERDDPKTMEVLTDKAIAWLEQKEDRRPFFLYFTPVAVHEVVTPSARSSGTSKAGPYGDFINDLDHSVGRIMDSLVRLGVADDTLLIFTSDNGGAAVEKSKSGSQKIAMDAGLRINGALRGGKHDIWQGGFRVPFIVRWPGVVPAGSTNSRMIGLVDLFATLSEVSGATLPSPDKAAPDSRSFHKSLLSIDSTDTSSARPDLIFQSASGVYALRSGPWKWIEGRPAQPSGKKKASPKAGPKAEQFKPQLFNLVDDPGETRDVADQHPDVVQRLSALLERQRSQGFSRD